MKLMLVFFIIAMGVPSLARSKIVSQDVTYYHGNVPLEGYLAYDDALTRKVPGILIIHDWDGLDEYEKGRARQLAALGYTAFALDMYGKGIRPENRKEAAEESGKYRKDRQLMRARAQAGLEQLKNNVHVDIKRLAVIGYCFGGGVALELARSGAAVKGVVTFHGNVDTPLPAKPGDIKARILILHGADDPHVTPEQIRAFQKEMNQAKVDWQIVLYGHAVHSFTNKNAGNDPKKGSAYNEKADKRSWEAMKSFFKEVL